MTKVTHACLRKVIVSGKRGVVYGAICINCTEVGVGGDERWKGCVIGWKLTNLANESSLNYRGKYFAMSEKNCCT